MNWVLIVLFLVTLAPGSGSSGEGPGYALVTSASNPVTSLKRRDVARMFLKKTTRWPDGKDVVPIDQSVRSPVRAAFTRDVLRADGLGQISAVVSYWQQEIYSGRGMSPVVQSSDAEVLAVVAATAGAIGYVSASADLHSVKTLTVEE